MPQTFGPAATPPTGSTPGADSPDPGEFVAAGFPLVIPGGHNCTVCGAPLGAYLPAIDLQLLVESRRVQVCRECYDNLLADMTEEQLDPADPVEPRFDSVYAGAVGHLILQILSGELYQIDANEGVVSPALESPSEDL